MIERTGAVLALMMLAACEKPAAVSNIAEPATDAADMPVLKNTVSNGSATAAAPATGREPIAYTSLKPADCKLLEQNLEEGGYSRHRCGGVAGYALETSESDLRQGLTIVAPGGKRTELDLSARVAKGAFNALGSAAEWRGKDRISPSALIVRLNVATPEPNRPDTSNLVVIRLGGPTCILAVVTPGPSQNDAARDVADDPSKDCAEG